MKEGLPAKRISFAATRSFARWTVAWIGPTFPLGADDDAPPGHPRAPLVSGQAPRRKTDTTRTQARHHRARTRKSDTAATTTVDYTHRHLESRPQPGITTYRNGVALRSTHDGRFVMYCGSVRSAAPLNPSIRMS